MAAGTSTLVERCCIKGDWSRLHSGKAAALRMKTDYAINAVALYMRGEGTSVCPPGH